MLNKEGLAELTEHHFKLMEYYKMVEDSQQRKHIENGTCKCGGCGWIIRHLHEHTETYSRITEYAIPCECSGKLLANRRIEQAGIPQEFYSLTLSNFNLDLYTDGKQKEIATDALKKASTYVRNYSKMRQDIQNTKGLYIYSSKRGSGKTRLAASIANNLMKRENLNVVFITSIDLLSSIKKCYSRESEENENDVVNKYCTVNVLVIDDIGAEKSSQFVNEMFFRILDTRMKNFRTTIFTSNLSRDDEKYEDRISDRLRRMTVEIKMPEESVRSRLGKEEEKGFFDMLER